MSEEVVPVGWVGPLDRLAAAGAPLEDLHREVRRRDLYGDEVARFGGTFGLAQNWPQIPLFAALRLRELFGDLVLEHSDDYVLAMVSALGDRRTPWVREHLLRQDHALREETFWRIFEVEGNQMISLANVDKFSFAPATWKQTVLTLVADGTLDRARVLRCCLEALGRDFSAYRAGWFSRMYRALAPTPQEQVTHENLLLGLLGSRVTAGVSLAVAGLVVVHRAGALDGPGFVAACRPALDSTRADGLAVLRVLADLVPERPEASDRVADALSHPHPDVQRAAVRTLTVHGRADVVAAHRAVLAPAVAAEVLGAESPSDDASPVDPGGGMAGRGLPLPTRPAPLVPWDDTQALDGVATLLEDPTDPIAFEALLAWLAAHPDPAAVLAPVARRARDRRRTASDLVAGLVVAVTDPEADPRPVPEWWAGTVVPLLTGRVAEVVEGVRGRSPRGALLATPTDADGWISPQVLVDRFLAREPAGAAPAPLDLVQALLRLGTQDRPAALALLEPHLGRSAGDAAPGWEEAGAALAHALGSDRVPVVRTTPWWAAAGCARGGPVHPALAAAGLDAPGLARPPVLAITWRSVTSTVDGRDWTSWWPEVVDGSTDPRRSGARPLVVPSGRRRADEDLTRPAELRALVHLLPSSTVPLVEASIGVLHHCTVSTGPLGETDVLDALAVHPGEWTAQTAQLVALALSSVRAEVRAQAAELLVTVVPARIDVDRFAAGMLACAPACLPGRWTTALADAASISAAGAATVRAVLTALLPSLDRSTRGVGGLVGLLLDEQIRAGEPVADPALREWLGGFRGSSQGARAARGLLTSRVG